MIQRFNFSDSEAVISTETTVASRNQESMMRTAFTNKNDVEYTVSECDDVDLPLDSFVNRSSMPTQEKLWEDERTVLLSYTEGKSCTS